MRNWLDNRDGKIAAAPARSKVPTFAALAAEKIAQDAPSWSERTRSDHEKRLQHHVYPSIGAKRVDAISTADLLRLFGPIHGTNTGDKARRLVRSIFALAIAKGYGTANPCAEQLEAALPRKTKNGKHHDAVPHSKLGKHLDAAEGWIGARLALKFVALTACRTGEARNATWGEIDGVTWTIPAERAKTRTAHRVALSRQALAILDEARKLSLTGTGRIFPAARGGVLPENAIKRVFKATGTNTTVHGLRSAFRDWCRETGVDRELAEAALAHVVGGTEGAYARSDLLEQRRDLMQAWADYLSAQE